MLVENHRFKCTIKLLTESKIEELMQILGVPRKHWTVNTNFKTGEPYAMEYSIGTDKQSAYLKLGTMAAGYSDIATGNICQSDRFEGYHPEGTERYYTNASLLLHGNWFDNAVGFNFARLLAFLESTGYSPTELDVAYVDNLAVTELTDWLRVFGSYKDHVSGNIVRKQEIDLVIRAGTFIRAQIGLATSKTMYGTFYQRPDGLLRLELKFRKSEQIRDLLSHYEEKSATYHKAAVTVLVASLDILTADSKKSRNPADYVREPFYAAFIASQPPKFTWKAIAKQAATIEKSLSEEYSASLKKVAGKLQNTMSRYSGYKSADEILADLEELLRHIKT